MRVNVIGVYSRRGQQVIEWNRVELTAYGEGVLLAGREDLAIMREEEPRKTIVVWKSINSFLIRLRSEMTICLQGIRGIRKTNKDLWGPMKEGYEIKGSGLSSEGVCILWDTRYYDKVSILWGDGEEVRLIHWGQLLRC